VATQVGVLAIPAMMALIGMLSCVYMVVSVVGDFGQPAEEGGGETPNARRCPNLFTPLLTAELSLSGEECIIF
jgi:hypothetical protein